MEPLELFARRQVLSVSELVGQLKKLAEERFDFVWVEGEVTGLRRPGSGHVYFALKDPEAQLRAVLFRHQAALMRFALEDGQRVLCQGRLSVYPARGEVQLVVDSVEPRGAGALALAFAQLRRRLEAQGLFDPERKQPLPDLPQRVAVITSPSGAAIHDFLRVLHRRFDRLEVAVYPVPVQGEGAAPAMVRALKDLAAWGWPQVIVLTRGGGSPEDLWAFNDEDLAHAIAGSPIPVVSAVGHEVDVTIADLVADLRAATPSAAAELLVRPRADLAAQLAGLRTRLARAGQGRLAGLRRDWQDLVKALGDPRRRLIDRRLALDDLLSRAGQALRGLAQRRHRRLWDCRLHLLARRPDRALAALESRRRELGLRLAAAGVLAVTRRRGELAERLGRLRALSPLAVLGRGYALAQDQVGHLLRQAGQVRVGQVIRVRLGQGALRARVEEVEA
ncbi:MAG: exodeoxyribonuclease VII large subunit [Desulfarculus sp.]|nr:exodeoxyribonuclease VII large subunit [Desulfarculus sp.]